MQCYAIPSEWRGGGLQVRHRRRHQGLTGSLCNPIMYIVPIFWLMDCPIMGQTSCIIAERFYERWFRWNHCKPGHLTQCLHSFFCFFLASSSQSVRKALFLVNWLAATPGNSLLLSAFLLWEIVMPNHPTLEHSQQGEKERENERVRDSLSGWPIAVKSGGNPANQE